jgi:AmmeMemoRadiSam system protein B
MTTETHSNIPERPTLRLVEPMWVEHLGQRFLHLRDHLSMSDLTVMIPETVAPVVTLLDGSRTLPEIRSALALRFGLTVSDQELRSMIGQLDEALLIGNGEFRRARRRALTVYREADHRSPSHVGAVYPESVPALEAAIDGWCHEVSPIGPLTRPGGDLVGMLCPHIDYSRGHATYAELWRDIESDLSEIDLVVILGTDHYGGLGQLTPTVQNYATPYGTLETDKDIVNRLAKAIGTAAFDEELHHRTEHSIELAAVWLHHFARGRDVRLVPILCGSFHDFTSSGADPDDVPHIPATLEVLEGVITQRRTLIIAAGDLAHVGPAFGDPHPLDEVAKAKIRSEDSQSISAICSGDARGFLEISRNESDRRKICGLPPIYLMLRLLDGARGIHVGYDQCPADPTNGSVVSIAGALLYR